MPQGKRKYDDIDQVLGLPSAPTGKYEDIDQVLGLKPPQPPQQPPGFWKNLQIGAQRALLNASDAGRVMEDAIGAAVKGDFTPIKQIGELVGRGAISMGNSIAAGPYQAGPAYISSQIEQAPRVAQIHEQQSERMAKDPELYSREAIAEHQRLDALAGQDPSLTGKITRGVSQLGTEALPAVITGLATGGSAPAIAGITSLQSMSSPENLALNVGLASTLPIVGRAVGTGVKALLGRGVEQGLESEVPEALQGATSQIRSMGPVSEMDAIRAKAGLAPLSGEGAPPPLGGLESVPTLSGVSPRASTSIQGPPVSEADLNLQTQTPTEEWSGSGKAIGDVLRTGSQALRTFRTAFDLSAPMNQGAFLSRAHPLLAVKSFAKMLKSLSPEASEAIDDAIINDPYKALGDQFDLYIATGNEHPEEAFLLRGLNKAWGIAPSERTYRTYLDTLRLSVWKSYVDSLQSDGLTPQNSPRAYSQAAQFVNISTGRGSLVPGGKLAKAMAMGGDIFFAPRNLVSKFQLMDPRRYLSLEPGARKLVLKDALTSFGSVLGTAALLNAAGVSVGFDPRGDDFLTARWRNTRLDLTGGLKTEIKFVAKMLAGTYNQVMGEGNLPNQDPVSVAEDYARKKLAPVPGLALDLGIGRDVTGQKMSEKTSTQFAVDYFAPFTVQDFYDAFKDSGWTGAAVAMPPSIIGVKVGTYPDRAKADWLNEPPEFRLEQRRFNEPRSFLQPKRSKDPDVPDETPEEFSSRKAQADQWMQQYGKALVNSDEYWKATTDQRKDALDLFKKRITSLSSKDEEERDLTGLVPEILMNDVKEQEENKAERKEERKKAVRPQKPSPPVLPSRQ
jgi:hypothetical protein